MFYSRKHSKASGSGSDLQPTKGQRQQGRADALHGVAEALSVRDHVKELRQRG